MVKGKSKSSDVLDGPLAEKPYKSGIVQVLRNTPVQVGDFDSKAILLLDVLHEKGRATEACQVLQNTLQGVQRKKVTNWRAYVYTLLRGIDEDAYNAMKESKENNGRKKRRPSVQEATTPSAGKKEFNKSAAEFVPGQQWAKPAEEPKSKLREDAAEFKPGVWPEAYQPPPPPVIVPASAMTFPTTYKPQREPKAMKPDAAEFIPGVSAYAGAMKPKKSKGNKNSKSSPTAAATPTPTAKSGPVTPGLLSGSGPSSPVTRDADVAAGGASSSSQPQPQAKEASPTKAAKGLSELCREKLGSGAAPQPAAVGKLGKKSGVWEFVKALSDSECAAVLSAAEQLGFNPAEQDRAGGHCKLVREDPYLADRLWQRVSAAAPSPFCGKRVAGVSPTLRVQHGSLAEVQSESLAFYLCLKSASGEKLRPGDLFILAPGEKLPADTPCASWLCADLQLESSWWASASQRFGFGAFNERRGVVLLLVTTAAATMLVTQLRHRSLRN